MGLTDKIKKLPTANELKGSFGEWMTKYYSKILTDTLILHDVLIDGKEGYTSQIDVIMIGAKGIYVIEVKMFEGAKIYGNGKNSKWYYYRGGKKFDIYSPLKQNKKHIEYLKEFLKDFGEIPFFSVITLLCDDFKVENINENPERLDTVVCNSLTSMTKGMQILIKDRMDVLDETKKQEIFDYISENQHTGKEARFEHKGKIKEYKENLEEMQKSKICPYCKTPLVLRKGKFGEFYGCSNYPKCRYTLKLEKSW